MKKILALLLVAVLSMSLFVGCSNEEASETTSTSESAETTAESEATNEASEDVVQGDPDHIIMTYLTFGATPADLLKVQDAVNEISIAEINVEVEFRPISVPETFAQYSLWISTGEQVDLMMSAFQGVANFANTGSIEPLNDLVDSYGSHIKELMEKLPITDGAVIDGEIYGIAPVQPNYGKQCGIIISEEELEGAGVEIKEMYTMEELTDVFAQIKAAYPDMYPYGINGASLTTGSLYSFFAITDNLGASAASGVLIGTDSTEIVNMFETEEYLEYLRLVRSWYQAGYIMPDAATNASISTELIMNDVIASYPMYFSPEQTAGSVAQYGKQFTNLPTSEKFFGSISPSSNTYWTIPVTSGNPEAAMKFLNLMYENHDLANTILVGIEGDHYVKTDQDGVIAFPDGVDASNSGFLNTLGFYGDRRYEYTFSASSSREVNEAYTEEATSNPTMATGYSYNSENMTNQLMAINSVLNQYLPSLETGSVDIDEIYPQMIEDLKNAGIDDVIADNQSQFDEWLSQQ